MESRHLKTGLIISLFAISVAVIFAYRSPALGYELSIYESTPVTFWVSVVLALSLSTFILFKSDNSISYLAGGVILLGSLTIIALPIIRGYYWIGIADPSTHYGWVKDLMTGKLSFGGFLYPLLHTLSILLVESTGQSLRWIMMFVVIVFALLFIIFVPLATRRISVYELDWKIALIAGAAFLPVNHIGTYHMFHPTSQSVMSYPLFLFALALYLTTEGTPRVLIFYLVNIFFVFLHPQHAINIIIICFSVGVLQIYHKKEEINKISVTSISIPSLATALVLYLSISMNKRFNQSLGLLVVELLNFNPSSSAVAQQGTSLAAVGGSLSDIFIKIFLISSVFAAAAVVVVLLHLHLFLQDREHHNPIIVYVGLSMVPLGIMTIILTIVKSNTVPLRYAGVMMSIATVIGAIGLGHVARWVDKRHLSTKHVQTLTAVVVLVMLLSSVPVMQSSPTIYKGSLAVSESTKSGFETSLDHRGEGMIFLNNRLETFRMSQMYYGVAKSNSLDITLDSTSIIRTSQYPDHFANQSLPSVIPEDRYVVVTLLDRKRDVQLYNEFRFSRDDFAYLQRDPNINNIVSTGEFDLHYVEKETNQTPSEID